VTSFLTNSAFAEFCSYTTKRRPIMTIEIKESDDATLSFEAKRCIHSRHCVLTRPDVFVPNVQGEWIHPEAASTEELMHLAKNCPSGAIRVTRKDGGAEEAAPVVNLVRVLENGPLAVTADLNLEGQGEMIRATLCRCGQSQNKPFCDGSHHAAGFTATGEVAVKTSEPLAQRNGKLNVQPTHNGPLRVTGNLEVISGTGTTVNRVTEAYLCRCGHSANKPYCDGTHAKIGFEAS
jgi:CDGSH-type Zn-finger protein/uncharacterized Fe-S cluster protein YjdI